MDKYLEEQIKVHHSKGNKSLFSDKKYKTYYMLQPLIDSSGYLSITVDARPLLKPYQDNLRYSLVVALFLLLMAFPVIIYASDRIIKPIKALLIENKKISVLEVIKDRLGMDLREIHKKIKETFSVFNVFRSFEEN